MKAVLTISPELLQIVGRKLYSSHPAIIAVRELLQNSRDACKRADVNPDIEIKLTGNNPCLITCTDNGIGMSQNDIIKYFLCLGGTNKTESDNVGGFGIAKAVLFSNPPWQAHTRDNFIDSDMLYNGEEVGKRYSINGTRVKITVDDYLYTNTLVAVYAMLQFSDTRITLTRDDESAEVGLTDSIKWQHKEERFNVGLLPKQEVLGITLENLTIYRVNGLVQFITFSSFDGINVIVDINVNGLNPKDDNYPLSLSRETITSAVYSDINRLIRNYEQNPLTTRSNMKSEDDSIKLYKGKYFRGRGEGDNPDDKTYGESGTESGSTAGIAILVKGRKNKPTLHEKRLLRVWGRVLTLVAHDDTFGVGIIKSDDTLAARLDHGLVAFYLLNVEKLPDMSKDGLILYLWSLATHEASHAWQNTHNEVFTSRMCDLFKESADDIGPALVDIKRTTARRI
jgi:hypothetical protein